MRQSVQGLWPVSARHPWRRLALAMLSAPALLAAFLVLLVLSLAAPSEGLSEVGPMAQGFVFSLLLFSLTLGLAGVAALWAMAQRGVLAWGATGGLLGLVFGTAHGVVTARLVRETDMVLAALIGIALFLLIRWLAGVRRQG